MCSNEKRKALIEKIVIIQEKCDNAVNKVEQANECMRMLKGEVRMKQKAQREMKEAKESTNAAMIDYYDVLKENNSLKSKNKELVLKVSSLK